MLKKSIISLVCIMALLLICFPSITVPAATTYQPTWESVDTHDPAPEWFQDAKFGVWFHWGPYSVPAYAYEWYPRNMYISGDSVYVYHNSVFGDPYTTWPYHNFINGANDKNGNFTQFDPKLVSNGGSFDPDAWAQLFIDSGAKIGGIMGEHHDGFSMWNSTVNEWNSVNKGPGLDLVGLLATAYRVKGLKVMISNHNAYNFTGYYDYAPAQTDTSLQKLYGQLPKTQEEQLWYDKLKEIVDGYQPDYIWNDFNLSQISEQQRLNFLAYYYNKAIDWNKEVVVSYNDGYNTSGELQQYERGGPADIEAEYWMSEDSISPSSWCYTTGMNYYSSKAMIHELIDRVSKNGTFILNIAPMADGSIPQAQKDILLAMGNWLGMYGEAIYSTRPWVKYGEGPTDIGGGSFTEPKECTSTDIRFTINKANNTLYAIDMGWPSNNQMVITSLKTGSINLSTVTEVSLGGETLTWSQDTAGLKVNLPSSAQNTNGVAVKIVFSGTIPALTFDATSQIEAEDYSSKSGTLQEETCSEGGLNLGYISDGDYAVYNNVNFDNGASTFSARVASQSNTSGGQIDLRLDSPTGTLIGSLTGNGSNGWQDYTTLSCNVSGVTGTHNLYLVFKAGYNLNWFMFNTFDPNKYYNIENHTSGKCIDNPGFSTADGTVMIQWTYASGTNQQWQIINIGNGYCKIKNRASGKVLDNGGSTTDGTEIKQWSDVSSPNLEWKIVKLENGCYKLVNHTSSKVLDNGGSTTDGTNIKQWSDVTSPNLEWTITQIN